MLSGDSCPNYGQPDAAKQANFNQFAQAVLAQRLRRRAGLARGPRAALLAPAAAFLRHAALATVSLGPRSVQKQSSPAMPAAAGIGSG